CDVSADINTLGDPVMQTSLAPNRMALSRSGSSMIYSGRLFSDGVHRRTSRMSDSPGNARRTGSNESVRISDPNHDQARREHLNQVLQRVAAGSQQAFSELYRLTSAHLFGVVLRMMRNHGEAEDMLQEIYASVWRRADGFDPARGHAMTWLITLARNRAIDRLRQHRETPLDEAQALDIPDDTPSPEALAELSQERQRLEQCLGKLDAPQRGAIREAFFSGATYSELAARLCVPLGTMKSWIRRSLMQLKVCLEQ
ncbi:MAG TPA: sigma-70 family RNA polymerase sigma factor, partial [Ktedonobacterales bacterium]|nr:sigma-70 family RNA polymerase sigma factor [Ktedonobacterales bacterium]